MIAIQVNVADGVSKTIRGIIRGLSAEDAADLNQVGGRSAVLYAARYHREFDQAGGWRGKRYLGPSQGQGATFGADVARGWQFTSSSPNEAVISNDASHYAFKVRGGTITPKRAKALTIPLIPEARGLYASVYSQNTGRRLFTIRGKHALFERVGGSTTGSRGRRGRPGTTSIRTSNIRAVYALVSSVTHDPWPGAVPPEAQLVDAFFQGWRGAFAQLINAS
jgi:hypothetical protein